MTEHQPSVMPGWVELYDLSVHRDTEAVHPLGYYVRGNVSEERVFDPKSEVLGGSLHKAPENTMPGWVELTTLAAHRDIEAVAPIEPYVHGVFDENAHFYPDEPPTIQGTITSE